MVVGAAYDRVGAEREGLARAGFKSERNEDCGASGGEEGPKDERVPLGDGGRGGRAGWGWYLCMLMAARRPPGCFRV